MRGPRARVHEKVSKVVVMNEATVVEGSRLPQVSYMGNPRFDHIFEVWYWKL